jgi:hypothetical protein
MSDFKPFECIIEVTSDWADVEFRGAELFNVETEIIEGQSQCISVKENKIAFALPQQRVMFEDGKGSMTVFFLKAKLSALIAKNRNITSLIIDKGDCGRVDIEINKCHFENALNLPDDCRNRKIIAVAVSSVFDNEVPVVQDDLEEPKHDVGEYPKILIVTPTKGDAHYLKRHIKAWENVDYPREKLRWVWIVGDSGDNTLSILEDYFSKRTWQCEIYAEPKFDNLTGNSMWIADVMNAARNAYRDEDFVVICDSDILKIQPSTLMELVKLDLDIVAPYPWHEGREKDFFDTYVFRLLDGTPFPVHDVPYKNSKNPVELASVGTMVIIRGNVFKSVEFDNPAPTLQFCKNARKKGYKVWGIPWLKVLHADVGKEGQKENHGSPEDFVKKGILPKSVLEKLR